MPFSRYKLQWRQCEDANAGLMLGRRRRRRPNINPALAQRLVFVQWAGLDVHVTD